MYQEAHTCTTGPCPPTPTEQVARVAGFERDTLRRRLEQLFLPSCASRCGSVLMRIDVDRFAIINESLGEAAGDSILVELGHRLAAFAGPSGCAARLGDDEFGLLVGVEPSDGAIELKMERARAMLAAPMQVSGTQLDVAVSVGVVGLADVNTPDEALRGSSVALRRAKAQGGASLQQYQPAIDGTKSRNLHLEIELREALRDNQFVLHYQPRVSCQSGAVVGFEALLRWQHPERGLLGPVEFIEVLEGSSLIADVGGWVLRSACHQAVLWNRSGAEDYVVSVNVAARQIQHGILGEQVERALLDSGLKPELLELELTESVLMETSRESVAMLTALRRRGMRVSIDDFGTGYSSLAYLRAFPVDVLKVDRSFVQDVTAEPDDASITRAIITMAHNLKLTVVAEGVETHGQLALLVANQCDEIQGYFFSRPLPVEAIDVLIREGRRLPATLTRPRVAQQTLLLVDDEPNILAALKRLLRRDGYQILTASSGQEGLELLAQHNVDVIVSDQRMPTMTGVDFLRRAKEMYPNTVRMVLSGYTEFQSITDAINEGAIYRYLTKPWDDGQLRAHVTEAFRYKAMSDENRRLQTAVSIANKEMASVNEQLKVLLADMQHQISRDSASLDVAREIIEHVPVPLIGIDVDGLVVFSNPAADRLLGARGSLLGMDANELVVAPAPPALSDGALDLADGRPSRVRVGGRSFVMRRQPMGRNSGSQGELLILVPIDAVPAAS